MLGAAWAVMAAWVVTALQAALLQGAVRAQPVPAAGPARMAAGREPPAALCPQQVAVKAAATKGRPTVAAPMVG